MCIVPLIFLLLLWVWAFPIQEAGADDTGLKVATAIVDTGTWTNCTAAQLNSNNNQYATNSNPFSYCVASTFAFGIPTAKTINGIEVQVEGSITPAGTASYQVALSWNAGSTWTSSNSSSFSSTTDVTRTHGGATNTWGRTWKASEFLDANFRLRICRTSGSATLRVDMIQVKVYYSAYVEKVAYSSPTTGTSWVVPSGVTSITVKAWGAGGAGGGGSSSYAGGNGAGAGFAQATLSVTPAETLTVRVGGGGDGGGVGYDSYGAGGGGGGGYSGVFRSSTKLIVAAGGGGGGGAGGGDPNYNNGYGGGVGGGTTGGNGETTLYGYGGTSSAGGSGGSGAGNGSSLVGGYGGSSVYGGGGSGGSGGTNGGGTGGTGSDQSYSYTAGGGGGGAGHYGGGGGGRYDYDNSSSGGGGGGSSYTTGTGTSTSSGSGTSAGNSTDSDYADSAGQGGYAGSLYSGGYYGNAGRVVISYSPTITLDDHSVGQESNKLAGVTWVRAGEVFAFSLTNSSGSQATVTQVQFQLSSVTGISQTDIGNFLIYVDSNNDGAIGTGETTTVGGSGTVNSGPTTITFSSSFNVAASSTVNYILIGDAANLASGDTMTIALGSSNITLSSVSKGGSTTSVTQAATPTKVTYTSATSGTSWVVPTGVTSITVKAWGGGAGGGAGSDYYSGGSGAGAGFARATITVTPAETLTVRVGGGGGGGSYGSSAGGGGGGGGYSGVFRSSTALIIAAGGGGGGGAGNASGYQGGEGGGTTGGYGGGNYGSPGTPSSGGSGGTGAQNGWSRNGGYGGGGSGGGYGGSGGTNGGGAGGTGSDYDLTGGGGGGGSGYYGGGGGGSYSYFDYGGGGAGGGSSYMTGTSTSTSSGSGMTAGNTGDSDYAGSAGQGGYEGSAWGNGSAGTDGRVVIAYLTTPTAVTLTSFAAFEHDGQVLLQWKTGYEVDNLGFHIYREENGERFRVTPELIAGSAFLTGAGTPLTAGRSYVWFDSFVSSPNAEHRTPNVSLTTLKYYLEDWDLSGKRTMHGPVTPVRSETPLLKYGNTTLLSELGKRQNQKYDEFWRIQEIRERLRKDRPAERGSRTARIEDRGNASPPPTPSPLEGEDQGEGTRSAPNAEHRTPNDLLSSPNVERRTPNDSLRPPQAQRSLRAAQALASQPGIKISIREQGWYRVTQPELIAAGLDPAVDPRRLRLYVDGEELAILVQGEGDGRFNPADSVEFYGTGQDTPFTDTRIYWLIEGTRPGKRVKTKQSRSWIAGDSSFPHTVHLKERSIYFAALKNGDTDNFFGAVVSSEGADHILNITNIDPSASGDALLEVALQGGTNAGHRVKVFVNDSEVMEMKFEGMVRKVMSTALPQSLLRDGENLVSLVSQEGDVDVSAVDCIRLTYWHTHTAEQDALRFSSSSGREITINGFTTGDIRVADVTNPRRVREIAGGVVEAEGPLYTVRFGVTGSGKRTLLAFTEGTIKSPESIGANEPSTWHLDGNSAGLVIITHQDFIDSLGPLKSLREMQGWSVAVIDVQDLYDEFSFGVKNPQALKDFLQRARASWQGPPRFVLLVGDASFDYRNYLGLGDFDFVPTKLIDTDYLETASDDWFVDFKNNGLPAIPIGRVPVRTAEEAALVISKIVAYENAPTGVWTQQAAMIADKMEEEDTFDFQRACTDVEALLPGSIASQEIFRAEWDDETMHTQIVAGMNAGKLLVNYVGHGSVEFWRGGVFDSDDTASLTNGARLPLFVAMTCLNGYFHDPFPTDSLAESLLRAEGGGAIAVWTSSGLTRPEGQALMNKRLISLLFDGTSRTLGEATMQAKTATTDMDVRRTWILFGDPTTRLK